MLLRSPFPWFGGKSRVSHIAWEAFGDVRNYVEPFYGSGAVLLGRTSYDPLKHTETINDLDCFVANFWRALQSDPEAVAYWADQPVNEADLHSRHLWLINRHDFREKMLTDPVFFDSKVAGWWVWGQCCWIGSGWCAGLPDVDEGDTQGDNGRGVHRQLPHLGNNGRGVHRQLPHLGDNGMGVHRKLLYEYFEFLAERLRRVRVCCGDWTRILGPSPTEKIGITGVFLDPPYAQDLRESVLYAKETPVSDAVREWAIANGQNPRLRIALCGYEAEHEMPDDWECIAWKAPGGYGSQGKGRGRENAGRERIWFSPHCLRLADDRQQLTLFGS